MRIVEPYWAFEAPPDGRDGAENFLDSSIGTAFVGICGAVGVIVAVVCIFRMINNTTRGRPGEGFKILIFGLVIGGLLFNLNITLDAIDSASGLVQDAFTSIDDITGSG